MAVGKEKREGKGKIHTTMTCYLSHIYFQGKGINNHLTNIKKWKKMTVILQTLEYIIQLKGKAKHKLTSD